MSAWTRGGDAGEVVGQASQLLHRRQDSRSKPRTLPVSSVLPPCQSDHLPLADFPNCWLSRSVQMNAVNSSSSSGFQAMAETVASYGRRPKRERDLAGQGSPRAKRHTRSRVAAVLDATGPAVPAGRATRCRFSRLPNDPLAATVSRVISNATIAASGCWSLPETEDAKKRSLESLSSLIGGGRGCRRPKHPGLRFARGIPATGIRNTVAVNHPHPNKHLEHRIHCYLVSSSERVHAKYWLIGFESGGILG